MRRRWGTLSAVMVVACLAAAGEAAFEAPSQAAPVPRGTQLFTERFTGATADSRFLGYGSACLTGAPRGTGPTPGDHTLGGCGTTQVGPVPPGDGAPYGYLQLTSAAHDQAGAVLFESPIHSTDGLDITFEQWQYGRTDAPVDADGISFFLTNGSAKLTDPGAFGGSLGYAQKLPDDDPARPFIPGVNEGYLGVGLDVLGNYFGDWEKRGNECAHRSPSGTAFHVPAPGQNMVTVRGPGHGTDGYCWLDATTSNKTTTGPWPSTLTGNLVGPLTSIPPGTTPHEAQTLLEPSKRTVKILITPAPHPRVMIDIDFHDGAGMHQVLAFNAPEPEPAAYKFGFAASTGLFTDVHLVRNVVITTYRPEAELRIVKRPDPAHQLPRRAGEQAYYEFTVTNTGEETLTHLTIHDPRVGHVSCPRTTLAPGHSMVCHGNLIVNREEAAAGHVSNVAFATGRRADDGGLVTSNESRARIHIRPPAHVRPPSHIPFPPNPCPEPEVHGSSLHMARIPAC